MQTSPESLVPAKDIGDYYNVSSRFILQLATEGSIPSVRIGKKCIRFDFEAVKQAVDSQNGSTPNLN